MMQVDDVGDFLADVNRFDARAARMHQLIMDEFVQVVRDAALGRTGFHTRTGLDMLRDRHSRSFGTLIHEIVSDRIEHIISTRGKNWVHDLFIDEALWYPHSARRPDILAHWNDPLRVIWDFTTTDSMGKARRKYAPVDELVSVVIEPLYSSSALINRLFHGIR